MPVRIKMDRVLNEKKSAVQSTLKKASCLILVIITLPVGCKSYPKRGELAPEVKAAIQRGDVTFVQRQLDNRLMNPNDSEPEDTALEVAINSDRGNPDDPRAADRVEMVRLLLKAGAEPNYIDPRPSSATFHLNASDDPGPLWRAIRTGDFAIVKLLISAGADVNHVYCRPLPEQVCAPVLFAASRDYPLDNAPPGAELDIYNYLIQKGAKPIRADTDYYGHDDVPRISQSWLSAKPLLPACDKQPPFHTSSCSWMNVVYAGTREYRYSRTSSKFTQQYKFEANNWNVDRPLDPKSVPVQDVVKTIREKYGSGFGGCSHDEPANAYGLSVAIANECSQDVYLINRIYAVNGTLRDHVDGSDHTMFIEPDRDAKLVEVTADGRSSGFDVIDKGIDLDQMPNTGTYDDFVSRLQPLIGHKVTVNGAIYKNLGGNSAAADEPLHKLSMTVSSFSPAVE